MNTMIQIEHIQNTQTSAQLETIDLSTLSSISGGKKKENFLQRWGENMTKGGEYALAAGAVGTAVPVLGETGIPEGVAAGGGASWLLGKGVKALGGLF
jgi:hypothetical protein